MHVKGRAVASGQTKLTRACGLSPKSPRRVFVLADPDVFSGPVGQVVSSDIETSSSGGLFEPLDHMRCAVQHALQAVLGAEQCHGTKLAQALRVSQALLCFISLPASRSLKAVVLPSHHTFRHAVVQLKQPYLTVSISAAPISVSTEVTKGPLVETVMNSCVRERRVYLNQAWLLGAVSRGGGCWFWWYLV